MIAGHQRWGGRSREARTGFSATPTHRDRAAMNGAQTATRRLLAAWDDD
jgi:hypothetical protein